MSSLKAQQYIRQGVFILIFARSIHDLCNKRKTALDESRKYYQFLEDSEMEEAWLVEKSRAMKSQDVGKDLAACNRLLMKHQVSCLASHDSTSTA